MIVFTAFSYSEHDHYHCNARFAVVGCLVHQTHMFDATYQINAAVPKMTRMGSSEVLLDASF